MANPDNIYNGLEPPDMYSGRADDFGSPTAVYKMTRNAARCKNCNTVIESTYRHDFVTCPCGNISVDGGLDYARRSFKDGNYEDHAEDLSEYVRTDRSADN